MPTGNDPKTHIELSLDLSPGERVQITVESLPGEGGLQVVQKTIEPAPAAEEGWHSPPGRTEQTLGILRHISSTLRMLNRATVHFSPTALFRFGLALYLLTRLVGLASYPANFFCDEAVNTTLAENLVQGGLRSQEGGFLPTFFQNDGQFCLGTSVYMQVLPFLLFGKSVWVTRAVVALASLLAVFWMTGILRDIFRNPYWWSVPFLLAAIPLWFLYTRTAFEYAYLAIFYSGFIYYYLLYREGQPKYLYAALVCGALAFYSYSPGQIVMAVSGVLLFFSDLRCHLQNRRTAFTGLGVIALLALPLVRFVAGNPGDYTQRLIMYNSYLETNLTTLGKISRYLVNYLSGLNPFYWFFPNNHDLIRHRMAGYGFFPWLMLPFVLWGLYTLIRGFRESRNRVILAGLLAAPAGAALIDLTVHREISIILPLAVSALIGFNAAVAYFSRRRPLNPAIISYALVVSLSAGSLFMLVDALKNGKTWFHDYGLDGLQWGASQVFSAAEKYSIQHPDLTLAISPNWTFQADKLMRFFLPNQRTVIIGTADRFMDNYDDTINQFRFVLIPGDYQKARESGKFLEPVVEQVISFPDGNPGFYFVSLMYRDNAGELFRQDAIKHAMLETGRANILGVDIPVYHTRLDMGPIETIFDGDLDSVTRTSAVNPFVVEFAVPAGHPLRGLSFRLGSEEVKVTVTVDPADGSSPQIFTCEAGGSQGIKDVRVEFGKLIDAKKLKFEVLDVASAARSFVHIWEVQFLE